MWQPAHLAEVQIRMAWANIHTCLQVSALVSLLKAAHRTAAMLLLSCSTVNRVRRFVFCWTTFPVSVQACSVAWQLPEIDSRFVSDAKCNGRSKHVLGARQDMAPARILLVSQN